MFSLVHRVQAGEMDTLGFIAYAKSVGAQGVELLDIFWKGTEGEAGQIRNGLAEHGLTLAAWDAGNNFCRATQADRDAEAARLCAAVDLALELGTRTVRVFGGDPLEGATYEQCIDWIVEGLSTVSAYAAKRGAVLALENHGRLCGRGHQVKTILDRVNSPSMQACVDMANFLLVDDIPRQSIRLLAPQAGLVHVKEFQQAPTDFTGRTWTARSGLRYRGVIAGGGDVDLTGAVADLKAAGYDGWWSIEFQGHEEPAAATAASLATLQRTLAQ